MRKRIPQNLIITICSFLFVMGNFSCFHKSAEKGNADNIIKAVVHSDDEGPLLILHEVIFQATSKSSGNGITHITGYEETRVSSYDLKQGTLTARQVFGKRKSHPLWLLGTTPSQIWFFSNDKNLGLHARHPRTLEILVNHEEVVAKNPQLKGQLAQPEWYKINRFFNFDNANQQLIVTDNQGYRYFIDPQTLVAKKLTGNYQIPFGISREYLGNSVHYHNNTLRLQGQLRKLIKHGSTRLNNEISFLDGKIIKEQNPSRMARYLNREFQRAKKEYLSIQKQFEILDKDSPGGRHLRQEEYSKYRNLRQQYRAKEREFQTWTHHLQNLEKKNRLQGFDLPLMADNHHLFIAHRTNTNQNARLLISKIKFDGTSSLQEVWRTTLEELFFDYRQARETNDFKVVFSKGHPEFDFQYFDIYEDKMIIVHTLHACCLDVETGKINWIFRL